MSIAGLTSGWFVVAQTWNQAVDHVREEERTGARATRDDIVDCVVHAFGRGHEPRKVIFIRGRAAGESGRP